MFSNLVVFLRRVWAARAVHAQTALGLGGWAFLVAGVAHLVGTVAWYFGASLLCFALFGFKMLAVIVTKGLYALATEDTAK